MVGSNATSRSSYFDEAHRWRMRAAEMLTLADEFKGTDAKQIMLRIAAEYEKLAEWAEKTQRPGGTKKRTSRPLFCTMRHGGLETPWLKSN